MLNQFVMRDYSMWVRDLHFIVRGNGKKKFARIGITPRDISLSNGTQLHPVASFLRCGKIKMWNKRMRA
jgi:hypothetical protein